MGSSTASVFMGQDGMLHGIDVVLGIFFVLF